MSGMVVPRFPVQHSSTNLQWHYSETGPQAQKKIGEQLKKMEGNVGSPKQGIGPHFWNGRVAWLVEVLYLKCGVSHTRHRTPFAGTLGWRGWWKPSTSQLSRLIHGPTPQGSVGGCKHCLLFFNLQISDFS